jgi:hypothetical protein
VLSALHEAVEWTFNNRDDAAEIIAIANKSKVTYARRALFEMIEGEMTPRDLRIGTKALDVFSFVLLARHVRTVMHCSASRAAQEKAVLNESAHLFKGLPDGRLIPDVLIEGSGAFPAEIDNRLSDRSAPARRHPRMGNSYRWTPPTQRSF